MSVVILGGNECMERKYKELCKSYNCKVKVFTKIEGTLRDKIGSPDLLVLFTGTLSHKMLRCALSETKSRDMKIARAQSVSITSLKNILDTHAAN